MAQPSSNDSNETTTISNSNVSSATGEENPVIKIKQERIDPEIETKIHLLNNNIKIEPPDENTHEANGHTKNQYKESDDDEEDSNDSDSSEQDPENEGDEEEEEDEKKNIEPVKSSNEILAELFKVFNAAPPEELLDDKNLIKKAKKHKKEKKKKRKKSKGEDSVTESEDGEVGSGEKHKHKKSKKKHKHKHKEGSKEKTKERDKHKEKSKKKDRDKERAKSKDKDRERSKRDKKSSEREKSRDRAKSRDRDKKVCESGERKRHHEKEDRTESSSKRKKTEGTESKTNSFYNGFKERENSMEKNEKEKVKIKTEPKERKSRRDSEDGHISEISLSDEETYLKEKESHGDYSKRKVHNSFYESSRDKERHLHERGYSREHYRDRDRDRDRERERDGSYRSRGFSKRYYSLYSRSRSRSRSKSRDLGIDKKRLLEIARKNAISMFKRGNLPGCDNMSQEIKDKVLLKMRYGGRTVEDLTEFCKKISNGENLSELSSDEDSDVDKVGNTKAFHHPFQLKEREPIVMHIRNSKPIVPVVTKTEEQTKAITMQFPVSSGQQHRLTEHWMPVENKDNLPPLPALPTAAQSTAIFKNVTLKNALGKPLPTAEEQEPAFKPVAMSNSEAIPEIPAPQPAEVVPVIPAVVATPVLPSIPITVPPPPIPNYAPALSTAIIAATTAMEPAQTPTFVPDVPVPSTNNSVFPQTNCNNLDVSSIISKRLNAMRRLQENPLDSEAIKMMYNSQREMSTWASSKHLPGQFTGSTGVNILKPNELNSGPQVWARRDQLTSTKPVTGGMGMHLLQKMGWKPGEGLGREKNGSLQPLLLDVKLDKRGLVAQEDCHRRSMLVKKKAGGGVQNSQMAQQNIEGKHPVCLLNELTSKRKWTPPLYTLVNENGPSHSKMFLFSVQVNGQTFTPNKACNTKKEAKMIAAKHCLEEIGILPKC